MEQVGKLMHKRDYGGIDEGGSQSEGNSELGVWATDLSGGRKKAAEGRDAELRGVGGRAV